MDTGTGHEHDTDMGMQHDNSLKSRTGRDENVTLEFIEHIYK